MSLTSFSDLTSKNLDLSVLHALLLQLAVHTGDCSVRLSKQAYVTNAFNRITSAFLSYNTQDVKH